MQKAWANEQQYQQAQFFSPILFFALLWPLVSVSTTYPPEWWYLYCGFSSLWFKITSILPALLAECVNQCLGSFLALFLYSSPLFAAGKSANEENHVHMLYAKSICQKYLLKHNTFLLSGGQFSECMPWANCYLCTVLIMRARIKKKKKIFKHFSIP